MPRTASGGMAVQHLADESTGQRRRSADDGGEHALGAGVPPRLWRAELAVTQVPFLRAPGQLEATQPLLPPVRPTEVERSEPGLAAPADGLHEQQVVRARAEEADVRRPVLVGEDVAKREEDGRRHRRVVASDDHDEPEALLEEALETEDEP